MSPRWQKVVRDLLSNKGRTILVVLAIAVGVFAFGGVFTSQEILVVNMETQYQTTHASTINLGLPAFDQDLVRWASREPHVQEAEGRIVTSVKLVREGRKDIFLLYAFHNFDQIQINRFVPQLGAWPPGKNEVLLERASAKLLGVPLNTPVTVETADGKSHTLTFVGTTHDLTAIPANLFPLFTGYTSTRTLTELDAPEDMNQLQIITTPDIKTQAQVEAVMNDLRTKLEARGISITSVELRLPGEHWAQPVTQGFVTILTAIGVFSLLLSGFLVINTISSTIAQQKRQIGMMKAIGATRKDVIQLYMINVAIFGILALFVALPVGVGLAYATSLSVISFLNLDLTQFYLPLHVVLLQVAASLIVPVAAAFVPVLNGVKITVREAISDYKATTSQVGFIDRLLFSIRSLPRPLLVSLRNTLRARSRLILTLSTLTLAGTFFLTIINVRASLNAISDKAFSMFNFDVQLQLDRDYSTDYVTRQALSVPGVTAVEGRLGTGAQIIKSDGSRASSFPINGIPADSVFVKPNMLSGRWLTTSDTNSIVLASELTRNEPYIKTGDEITLDIGGSKEHFVVAGILFTSFGERTAYVNFPYLVKVLKTSNQTSNLFVKTENHTGQFQSQVANNLTDQFKKADIGIAQAITQDTILKSAAGRTDFIIAFLMVMAAMIAFVGGLGLTSTMSLNVLERTREIGVMRSIGASSGSIRSIVLTEGLLIGFSSWLLAIPLSLPISFGFSYLLGQALFEFPLDFSFDPQGVIIWFAVIAVLATIACFIPSQRAVNMKVRDTLAYE